jgi:hypothetical protein
MTETKRVLRRVRAGDSGKCHCGLRRAFVAVVTFEFRNRFGLLQTATHPHSFCSRHGRLYASKFKLVVPNAAT